MPRDSSGSWLTTWSKAFKDIFARPLPLYIPCNSPTFCLNVATAQQEQELHNYLMTIQTAFRELKDSLIATRKIREQQTAQDRQIQGQQRTLLLATLRYENGYSSYLEVLDAQRSLFNAELQQVQLQRARLGAFGQSLQGSGRRMDTVNWEKP